MWEKGDTRDNLNVEISWYGTVVRDYINCGRANYGTSIEVHIITALLH